MDHEQAHQHLAETDLRLAALIARSLRYNIKPAARIRPFHALAESIAYQQLSGKAAATSSAAFVLFILEGNGSSPKKFSPRRTTLFVLRVFPVVRLPR